MSIYSENQATLLNKYQSKTQLQTQITTVYPAINTIQGKKPNNQTL